MNFRPTLLLVAASALVAGCATTEEPLSRKERDRAAREMEKAGLIDEMMNDTLESMDDEGIDEAADTEVNKVLDEITATLPVAANARLPEAQRVPAAAAAAREEANEDNELMARVAGLKAT